MKQEGKLSKIEEAWPGCRSGLEARCRGNVCDGDDMTVTAGRRFKRIAQAYPDLTEVEITEHVLADECGPMCRKYRERVACIPQGRLPLVQMPEAY